MGNVVPGEYLDALSALACDTDVADLGTRALERSRRVLADALPVIATGMQLPEMKSLVSRQLTDATRGAAWVIGTGRRANASTAALLNGTAGTWLELNDGHTLAKGHPGMQVVPAALALAQEMRASGRDLLIAIAVGYEIAARIGHAATTRLAVHPHGTWGVIGAAVAVGRLKRFDRRTMRELINVSATMGMGTSRNTLLEGSTVRNIYTGHSGFMGLLATQLVEAGFTGEADGVKSIYEGVLADGFSPEVALAGLGREWMIAEGYFKLHPTGRGVHSAIDALEAALRDVPGQRIAPAQIERIEVMIYKVAASPAAMLSSRVVTSSFGAKFSTPFALATILVHGRSGVDCFDDAAVSNPAVQALAACVDVREEPAYTAKYPGEQNCTVRLLLKSGGVLEGHCTIMKGEPGNPHKPEELENKFFTLGTPVWGQAVTGKLHRACMQIEDLPDFGALSDELAL